MSVSSTTDCVHSKCHMIGADTNVSFSVSNVLFSFSCHCNLKLLPVSDVSSRTIFKRS